MITGFKLYSPPARAHFYDIGKKQPLMRSICGFFLSPLFLLIPALVTSVCAALGDSYTMVGIVINAELVALTLFLCDDIAASLMPFLAVMCGGATLFQNWEVILPYIIPWGIPVALGFVFHFAFYRKPARVGISFYGLVLTAAAILLGGIGANVPSPFFGAADAFYYFGLSFGLLLLYLIFSRDYKEEGKSYDPYDYLLATLLLASTVCAVIVLSTFRCWLLNAEELTVTEFRVYFSARNSLGNIMIMGIPAPFYFAKKNAESPLRATFCFVFGLFLSAVLLLTTSRTAIVVGGLLLLFSLLYYMIGKRHLLRKCIHLTLLLVPAALLLRFSDQLFEVFNWHELIEALRAPSHDISDLEQYSSRTKLLLRAFEDLAEHPLFGIGLLSSANADLYGDQVGCMTWYHSYFPQVFGSMGLFGCAAYSVHLGLRAKLMLARPTAQTAAVSLSALGLFLYSMTDPGEFMTIPFGMMAVLMFVLLERHAESDLFWQIPKNRLLAGRNFSKKI